MFISMFMIKILVSQQIFPFLIEFEVFVMSIKFWKKKKNQIVAYELITMT